MNITPKHIKASSYEGPVVSDSDLTKHRKACRGAIRVLKADTPEDIDQWPTFESLHLGNPGEPGMDKSGNPGLLPVIKECNRCGECCKYIAVRLANRPPRKTEYMMEVRAGRELVSYKGSLWWVLFCPCPCLTPEGDCAIYDERPEDCRRYPAKGDWRPEGCTL